MTQMEQVLQDALELNPEDRATLIDHLNASIGKYQEEVLKSWVEEADARLAAFESGAVDAVDAEKVFEQIRRGELP